MAKVTNCDSQLSQSVLGGNTNSLMIAIVMQTNSSGEMARITQELVGCSLCWGAEAFTRPLGELERVAHAGDLPGAHALLTDICQKVPHVRSAFKQPVQTLPTSNS
jgi:hypothetical protein